MKVDNRLKVGMVGLGQRGRGLLTNILNIKEVLVTSICDVFEDRREAECKRIVENGDPAPQKFENYNDLIKSGIDIVIVSTSWDAHVAVALACMEANIPVAIEVGGTHSIDDCWKLVDCYERTQTPFMFLENCCYYKDETLVTSLVRNGVLGNISYCQGSYCHDLREEIAGGIDTHHYRLKEYSEHNCENYPTHELGPIAKILNINSGNRFVKLVSMASKAQGMKEYIQNNDKYKDRLKDVEFKQGDVVNTIIQCENGETICLKLDTTLPRLYERGITVSGTKGHYYQTLNSVVLDNGEFNHETDSFVKSLNSADKYTEYQVDDWRTITQEQMDAGHGGMDYIMLKHLFKTVKEKKPMPIDVYDAVSWMSITALSEQSIANGSNSVDIPDFTRGKYKTRKTVDVLDLPKIIK